MTDRTASASPHTGSRPEAGLDDLLAQAGKKYAVVFEPVSAGGVTLEILQIADMRDLLDAAIADNALADAVHTLPLWAKIWPASLVLGHVLARLPAAGRNVLEIGAGCGVAGLVAAALGFPRVCITDINEDALLFARINAIRNGLQDRVEIRRADICSDNLDERFSLILGSEILYLEPLYRPLVKFLKRHLAAPARAASSAPGSLSGPAAEIPVCPEVILATDHRRTAKPFFKRAEKEFRLSRQDIGVRERLTPSPAGFEARPRPDAADAADSATADPAAVALAGRHADSGSAALSGSPAVAALPGSRNIPDGREGTDGRGERHLFTLHRLTPLAAAR